MPADLNLRRMVALHLQRTEGVAWEHLHGERLPLLDDEGTVGHLLALLDRAGARPHVRYRERDVEVVVGVRERGMDGARARRVRLTGATAGEALARAVVEVVRV